MPRHADPLEDIAASAGWLELGTRLYAAMEAHAAYGLPRPEDVLKDVARLRGQTPVSVRDAVVAARYARMHFSDLLRDDPELPIGVSNLKQLALLGNIEGPEVDSLRQKVIEGRISFRAVAKEVERIRELYASLPRPDAKPRSRLQTVKKSREFEENLRRFVEEVYIPSQPTTLTLKRTKKLEFLPVDFLIMEEGRPAIAVEIKTPREEFHERMLIENLGLCLLARQKVPKAWFITPIEWKYKMERIVAIAANIGVTGIHFMTFAVGNSSLGDSAALEEIRLSNHRAVELLRDD